jgi:hypothetical protein
LRHTLTALKAPGRKAGSTSISDKFWFMFLLYRISTPDSRI